MITSWVAMVLIVLLSVLVGRALTRLVGEDRWGGLEPAVGFAALISVGGVLARLPGGHRILILALLLLVAVSIWILRRPGRADLPAWSPGLPITLGLVFLAINIPFLISGHWGLLGVGYNNDLGLHLAWADWLRSGVGTEATAGYPLGPHALTATLSFVPGLSVATVFTGQLMAIVLLTAWTAWTALDRLGGWRRILAAVLAPGAYLLASWYAQAAFKEVATALLLLAFTVWIGRTLAAAQPFDRRKLPLPLILCAGIVFSYSFPGLVWPVAVAIAVVVTNRQVRVRLKPATVARVIRRPMVALGLSATFVLVLILAFAGPFGFSGAFKEVAASGAFGPVSPLEGLGIWLNPDYRLNGSVDTLLPGLGGAIALMALLLALWWWSRQRWSVWPAAFLGCLFVYLVSLPWMGDYSLAKALTVSSPVVMIVVLVALLSGLPAGHGRSRAWLRAGWVSLTGIFILGATASSLLVLRDAPVAPPGQAVELTAFHDKVNGHRVLYLDQDRFAPWYLSGAHVAVPLGDFPDPDVIENPKKPFQFKQGGQSTIDFDSFAPRTFRNFDFAITTAAGWQSATPRFFTKVKRTANYILWRRTGPVTGRSIMREAPMPAKLADCEHEGVDQYRQLKAFATVMPETEVIGAEQWQPGAALRAGKSAAATVTLPKGHWRMSIQYFSPGGFTLEAPGYQRRFRPALNGQRLANMDLGNNGQYWQAGVLRVDRGGPVRFEITTREPSTVQRLTGYSRRTQIGRLVLTRNGTRDRVPMSRICGRWVDFFRMNKPSQP